MQTLSDAKPVALPEGLAYVMRLEGVSLPDAAALLGSDDWTPRDPVAVAKAAKAADAKKAAMVDLGHGTDEP